MAKKGFVMKRSVISIFLVLSLLTISGCVAESTPGNGKLSTKNIERRVEGLLAKMTLEEKLGQMTEPGSFGDDISADMEKEVREGKVGSYLMINNIEKRNKLQKIAVEESRLGIPIIFAFDVIHGQRTIFPVPIAEASSWDLEMVEKTGQIAAKEARAMGIDWTFAPMIDISRDPRWGRIVEGAGEDPYLGSLMARAKVRGYQGDDFSDPERVAACLKHFAGYGASQAGRDYSTTEISERTLREIYLPPFKAGIDEGAATLMSGFNDLNGVPASGNKFLLTDILRDEWGFEGFVVSDWASVEQLIDHGIAEDKTQAAVLGVTSGVDMEMATRCYIDNLYQKIKAGEFPIRLIDESVRRILRVKFKAGLFEDPYADPSVASKVILAKEHLDVARDAARKSMVLLKNDGNLLPLKKDIRSIALIGPLADNQVDLLGTWALSARKEDVATVLDGLKSAVPDCKINYAKGCETNSDSTDGFGEAIKAAEVSDLVIMAIGESEFHNGESHCRTNIDLPGAQKELLQAIHKTGKPVVVVLFAGRPLTINWTMENIPSILLAWHPGIQGGPAIADVLFGDYNPAGKLTVTFPRNVGQIPIFYNMKNSGRPPSNDIHTSNYIDSPWTPLLPFGYGLSYTSFEYKDLRIENDKIRIPGIVKVSADITNTGKYAGQEVVQLYIRDIAGSVTRPIRELKGFDKISLKPGETKTVTFDLSTDDLRFYDINMEFNVEPGKFDLWIGTNSTEGLKGSFQLEDSLK